MERGRHGCGIGCRAHFELARILVELAQRQEQHRTGFLAQRVVLRVLDQADDLHHAAALTAPHGMFEHSPARRPTGSAPPRNWRDERLVDDRNTRRRRTIRSPRTAAAQDSHPHHLEVVGRNGVGKAAQRDTGRRHEAVDGDDVAPRASAEQARDRRARGADAGNGQPRVPAGPDRGRDVPRRRAGARRLAG